MPTAEYTYRFKDDDNCLLLTAFDVEFDYAVNEDDGDPYVTIEAIRIEGDVDLMSQLGWRKQMAMDIAEQITADADFVAGLIEGDVEVSARAYRKAQAMIDGWRTY